VVRFPIQARECPLFQSIKTGTHPDFCPLATGVSFTTSKTDGLWSWHHSSMPCAEIMNGWSYDSTSANAVMVYTETAVPLPFFLNIVSSFFHSAFLFLCLSFSLYTPAYLFHTRKKQKRNKEINVYGETIRLHRWASCSRKKWEKTKLGLKNCMNYKLQQLKTKVTCWCRMTNCCMITELWQHFPPCKNIRSTNSHAEFFVYISMRRIMPVGDYVTILSSTRPTLFFIKRLPSVFFSGGMCLICV
jgi:hypothetical protein